MAFKIEKEEFGNRSIVDDRGKCVGIMHRAGDLRVGKDCWHIMLRDLFVFHAPSMTVDIHRNGKYHNRRSVKNLWEAKRILANLSHEDHRPAGSVQSNG